MFEEIPVSEMGRLFLKRLNDYAVGGDSITPAILSYSHMDDVRVALTSEGEWQGHEGVHLNPSGRSLKTASFGVGKAVLPGATYYDRVFLMDFDIYRKDGSLKAIEETTPERVLERLRQEDAPLPFCYTYSGTPGNFHMFWIYTEPQPRHRDMTLPRAVYNYWGADPGFTNSVMRNPIYREAVPTPSGQGTHWWPEWSKTEPTLRHLSELYVRLTPSVPDYGYIGELEALYENQPGNWAPVPQGYAPTFQTRLSDAALVKLMRETQPGEGRWRILCRWVRRQVLKHFKIKNKPMTKAELRDKIDEGNSLFEDPVYFLRVREIEDYWTIPKQWAYVNRQRAAGANGGNSPRTGSSPRSRKMHADSLMFYFEIQDLREVLEEYVEGGLDTEGMTKDLLARDREFTGQRKARNGKLRLEYVAFMARVEPKETIDPHTGEVTGVVTPEAQLKNLLAHGSRMKYSREEYNEIVSGLTTVDPSGKLAGTKQEDLLSPTTRGCTYEHCSTDAPQNNLQSEPVQGRQPRPRSDQPSSSPSDEEEASIQIAAAGERCPIGSTQHL